MCVGEKRTLTIPSHMAYGALLSYSFLIRPILKHLLIGSRGFSDAIPPNSALVFTTELVSLDRKRTSDEL